MDDIYSRFEKYIETTNEKTVPLNTWIDNTKKLRGQRVQSSRCRDCNNDNIMTSNGALVCPNCGVVSHYSIETDYVKKTQAYKRMTHFRDWLTKTQAKHNPTISPLVIDLCKNADDKTYLGLKELLRVNNYSQHYEDVWFIISIVDPSAKLFYLTPSEELSLCNLFLKVQHIWEQIKPLKRKSIISYPFIISELLDIINRPELKEFFILPRYNKILEYKTQWKRIRNSPLFSLVSSRG